MRYVLGIDQGGSKTLAVIADETGRILGLGRGPGACHSTHGMQRAMDAVQDAVAEAGEAAGIAPGQVDAAAAGMTGVDWPDEAGLLRNALSELLGLQQDKILVVNDCIIAMRAATSSASGCVLCAGTGLNCAVRDGEGREYTYGFYIPDEHQGGIALGRRTLQAVYDAESGMGEKTVLTERVLRLFGCATVDDLLRRDVTGELGQGPQLKLPLELEQAALEGDQVSRRLLYRFGRETASYAANALKRFGMESGAPEVVLSGSVFKCDAPDLLQGVQETILEAAPDAVIIESEWEPVIGAVLLALDTMPDRDSALIQSHIKRDAQRFHMIRKQQEKGECTR